MSEDRLCEVSENSEWDRSGSENATWTMWTGVGLLEQRGGGGGHVVPSRRRHGTMEQSFPR